jgi:outer membrane protein TolC
VANNPALEAKWLSLLATDAGLAYAHKQRFPSLSLTASLGSSSEELSELMSNGIGWSLLGNITTPLFYAGELKANQEKARLATLQSEQAYLSALNSTFAQIENGLSKNRSLSLSFAANQASNINATLAEELSFEQYLKGLVSYTTVLEAQTRAFNAKSSMIQSKYQLIENRLQLHVALGGEFELNQSSGSL